MEAVFCLCPSLPPEVFGEELLRSQKGLDSNPKPTMGMLPSLSASVSLSGKEERAGTWWGQVSSPEPLAWVSCCVPRTGGFGEELFLKAQSLLLRVFQSGRRWTHRKYQCRLWELKSSILYLFESIGKSSVSHPVYLSGANPLPLGEEMDKCRKGQAGRQMQKKRVL